ncbi:long-chain fatty acid--CoA ligase [Porphyromonas pogonae]|uniref:AMP-dependent synthetase/ligase n=1 Tax=Porphyromonas pogonae TaxID=867595 RepID=UPI002E793F3D|nr:long-chain fatty acid--CoA ligase [Porphyromonas pogonae]
MLVYHLAELPQRIFEEYGNKTILKYYNKEKDHWDKLHGEHLYHGALGVAKAFAHIMLNPGDKVGIYSQNTVRGLYTEMGIFMMRGVSVPLYATASPEQVEFVVNDAGIETIFVGEQFQYNNAYHAQLKSNVLKRIIIFDEHVVLNPDDNTSIFYNDFVRLGDSMHNEIAAKVSVGNALNSDLAVIIYTSGTSGNSKGVMLTHSNFMSQIRVHTLMFPFINSKDTSMCFLPMSHIFEKTWVYFCLSQGVTIAILSDPKKIQKALPAVKPTLMCNVPRFWEKVYHGVNMKIQGSPTVLQRVYKHAINVGRKYRLDYYLKKKKAPMGLSAMFWFYDKTVFSTLKRVLGIQNGKFFPTAGAPLSKEVNVFLQSVNIPIIYGYGLTESTATVSCYSRRGFDIDSIGQIIPGLEVKIDPVNNEILLKGPSITTGYYKNPQANAESFTADGFFKTGDAGRIEGNNLYFLERIKDLFKTANGKYIAPQMIEGLLAADPFIEQVAVIGDTYKFVSALIYPNWDLLKAECVKRDLADCQSIDKMAVNHELYRFMMARIENALGALAQYEKIKRFTLLKEPFSIENGELTNTLKIKRRIVNEHYAAEIALMYQENI